MAQDIYIRFRGDTRALQRSITDVNRALNSLESTATRASRSISGIQRAGSVAASSLNGLKVAAGAVVAALAVNKILDITARFEDLNTTLASVTGSAEAGAEAFEFIQRFATQSQFGIEELTKTFIQLKAAGIEPTEQLLRTFTDTAAVTTDQLGSLEAITALLARTTGGGLGLEELERLADRGIPVYRILRDEIGLARGEISEFGQTAEGASKIVQALLVGLDREFGGATEARLQNLSTIMSNFRIAIVNAANAFGSGLAPAVKEITSGLTDFVNQNQELFRSLGRISGEALIALANGVKTLATNLGLLDPGGLEIAFGNLIIALGQFSNSFSETLRTSLAVMRDLLNTITLLADKVGLIEAVELFPGDTTREQSIDRLVNRIERLRQLSQEWQDTNGRRRDPYKSEITEAEELLAKLRSGVPILTNTRLLLDQASDSSQSFGDGLITVGQELIASGQAAQAAAANTSQYVHVLGDASVAEEVYAEQQRLRASEAQAAAQAQTEAQNRITALIAEAKAPYEQAAQGATDYFRAAEKVRIELEALAPHQRGQRALLQQIYEDLLRQGEALRLNTLNYGEHARIMTEVNTRMNDLNATRSELQTAIRNEIATLRNNIRVYGENSDQAELSRAVIQALTQEYTQVTDEINGMTGALDRNGQALSASQEYYNSLVESARRSVSETGYQIEAQQRLKADLDSGKISIDVYAAAMDTLTGSSRRAKDETTALERALENFNKTADDAAAASVTSAGAAIERLKDPMVAAREDLEETFRGLDILRDKDLISEEQYLRTRAKLNEEYAKNISNIQTQLMEEQIRSAGITNSAILESLQSSLSNYQQIQQGGVQAAMGMTSELGNIFGQLGTYNKRAFEAAKAFNIANAIMNTYLGATKALAMFPPPFNFIAAAGVVATGLAQVAAIRSQTFSGRALGGPVMGSETYMVGENGPELFTPSTSGRITRNDQIGGGQPVAITFNINAIDSQGIDQLLVSRKSVIQQVISDAMLEAGQRSRY